VCVPSGHTRSTRALRRRARVTYIACVSLRDTHALRVPSEGGHAR